MRRFTGCAAIAWSLFGCTARPPLASGVAGQPSATPAARLDAEMAGVPARMPEPVASTEEGAAAELAAADGEAVGPPRSAARPIPRNTAVLHVGDSFVLAGFAQALRPRLKAVGARYEVRSEQSSYTVTWASKIEQAILDTQPDLIIITLGANEVANVQPLSHAPAVRRIAKLAGKRPCVWVSPPMWRKDTGILDVIRENSAPCRFFDSDALVARPIARQSDKIHPSKEGGEVWAAAFWDWLHAERVEPPTGQSAPPWALRAAPPEEHRPRALMAHEDVEE